MMDKSRAAVKFFLTTELHTLLLVSVRNRHEQVGNPLDVEKTRNVLVLTGSHFNSIQTAKRQVSSQS